MLLAIMVLLTLTDYALAAAGTREDPIPMGTPVNIGDGLEITVLKAIPDATQIILAENMFNSKPKPGHQFFMTKIRVTYYGEDSTTYDGSYNLRAVGPSSVGYSTFQNSAGVYPDQLGSHELFNGGSIEGNVAWEIDSRDANALVMYNNPISFGYNKDRLYMALYGMSTVPDGFSKPNLSPIGPLHSDQGNK